MKTRVLLVLIGAVATGACILSPEAAVSKDEPQALGIILSVSGSVSLRGTSGPLTAAEGMAVLPGDTLVVTAGGRCDGFSPDGKQFDLMGPAEMVLAEATGGEVLNVVADWLRHQVSRWVGEERRQVLTTRAPQDWNMETEVPRPILPAQGGAVRPGRGRLSWGTIPGIERYRVTFAPKAGSETVRTVRSNTLILDDLQPGSEYVWKVSPAVKEWKGISRWHSFRVLTAAEETNLDRALQGMNHLESGFLLLSTGLHEAAISRFDQAQASAGDERAAIFWRAQALADLGLYEDAYRSLSSIRTDAGR